MRKILITLLLASAAATPAIAGPTDWQSHQQTREDRQQAREDRQQAREERAAPAQRPSFTPSARMEQAPQADRHSFVDRQQFSRPDRAAPQVDADAMRAQREAQRDSFAAQRDARRDSLADQRSERIEQVQQRFEQRAPGARVIDNPFRDGRDARPSARPGMNAFRDRRPPVVSETPRPGTQPPLRVDNYQRSHPQAQWNTSWRNNSRYDWQNYRRHHRSIFHIGFYYDPFGWGYQPFNIGWRLWPAYYSNRYWINDPWMYRLPYAPPGYVWVRYWDDALLVDTWSGTVVDMIPNFFW